MSGRLTVSLWGGESGRGWRRRVRLLVTWIRRAPVRRLSGLSGHSLCLAKGGSIAATATSSILLGGQFGCLVFRQSLLELCRRLKLWFFGTIATLRTWRQVARCSASFCFGLMKAGQHALVVLLYYFLWYSLHAEDLHINTRTVRQGVFDGSEVFFVDLVHVHIEA